MVYTILSITLLFLTLEIICKGTNTICLIAISTAFMLMLYCVVSGILFFFDCFSINRGLLFTNIGALLFFLLSIRENLDWSPTLLGGKKDLLLGGILIVAMLLTASKFELYGTGQDQGLYQAEAIELLCGHNEVQHDLEEYQVLDNKEERDAFSNMVYNICTGYYPLKGREFPTVKTEDIKSAVSGMYHGVQTFPALLALGGKLFGFSNMVQIQTIFFLCATIFLFYALGNLEIPIISQVGFTLLFVCSPLVIWISKSSFTEMSLTMLMSLYLYFLTENKNDNLKWMLGIPLFAFAYIHVSFLLLVPCFVVIHLIKFMTSGKKEYLFANILCAIGLSTGYTMMAVIAPQYFFDNCARLYIKPFVTAENILWWIWVMSIGFFCVSMLVCRYQKILIKYWNEKKAMWIVGILSVVLLLFSFVYGYKIGFLKKCDSIDVSLLHAYYGTGLKAFMHLTLYAIAMATGFFIFPAVLFLFISKCILRRWESNFLTIAILFFYCVIVQSVFIRREIMYYYYYSRYLVFYIPIVCMLGAILAKSNRFLVWILGISFIPMLIFDYPVVTTKDDTMWEWETLEDLKKVIPKDSAVILGTESVQKNMGLSIRAVTECSIFPLCSDATKQMETLKRYENVFYLTDQIDSENDLFLIQYADCVDIVYKDKTLHSEADRPLQQGFFPLKISSSDIQVTLYQYKPLNEIARYGSDASEMIVMNGERCTDYIVSTGRSGVVTYGPYIDLAPGKYYLNIRMELLKAKFDQAGTVRIQAQNGEELIDEVPIKTQEIQMDSKETIRIPFEISEDKKRVEFVISEEDGSKMRIYSYTINREE